MLLAYFRQKGSTYPHGRKKGNLFCNVSVFRMRAALLVLVAKVTPIGLAVAVAAEGRD